MDKIKRAEIKNEAVNADKSLNDADHPALETEQAEHKIKSEKLRYQNADRIYD